MSLTVFVFPELCNRATGDILRPQVKLFTPMAEMPASKKKKVSTRFTVKVAEDVQKVKETYDVFHARELPDELGPSDAEDGDRDN